MAKRYYVVVRGVPVPVTAKAWREAHPARLVKVIDLPALPARKPRQQMLTAAQRAAVR